MKVVQVMMTVLMLLAAVLVESRVVYLRSHRNGRGDLVSDPSEHRPAYLLPAADLEPAATHHGHHGRVQIKVYRGPDDGHHAPHGYWVKQPADDHY